MSSRLGPSVSGEFTPQIEADFRAGLSDSNPAARLASIQRLAALASPASRVTQGDEHRYGERHHRNIAGLDGCKQRPACFFLTGVRNHVGVQRLTINLDRTNSPKATWR